VAEIQHLSKTTVRTHLRAIHLKLGVKRRSQLVALLSRNSLKLI
jgi:DNA-binding CsgD family transcriptional regulator